jgi:hypothetical protein
MVKGISRQVIVVRQPDARLFEQAIFLLRADAGSVTDDELLRQANEAADDYLRRHAGAKKPRRFRWNAAGFVLLGAIGTGLAWLASVLI